MQLRRTRPGEVLTRLRGGSDLEQVLRESLRDPDLAVLLRPAADEWCRADGTPTPPPVDGLTQTPLHHGAELVGVVVHSRPLGRDARLVTALASAAALAAADCVLALRVQRAAEAARRARTAVVAAEDSARRGIERDLHDGAQQRLVAVALGVELVRLGLGDTEGAADLDDALDRTGAAVSRALAELRRLARGVFPAILGERGLAAALTTLAEEAAPRLHLVQLPDRRWPAEVETAAYYCVAAALAAAADGGVRACVQAEGAGLRVQLSGVRLDPARLLAVRDRVEAAGGRLSLDDPPGALVAVIPDAA